LYYSSYILIINSLNLTLLHERSDSKPQTVGQRELIMDDVAIRITRMRIVPLVRTESSHNEQYETNDQIGNQHVQPDLEGKRRKEGKQARSFVLGALEEDTDSKIHERLCEVDDLFTHVADCQGRHSQVSFLQYIL